MPIDHNEDKIGMMFFSGEVVLPYMAGRRCSERMPRRLAVAMSGVARTCHNNPMSLMQEYRLA